MVILSGTHQSENGKCLHTHTHTHTHTHNKERKTTAPVKFYGNSINTGKCSAHWTLVQDNQIKFQENQLKFSMGKVLEATFKRTHYYTVWRYLRQAGGIPFLQTVRLWRAEVFVSTSSGTMPRMQKLKLPWLTVQSYQRFSLVRRVSDMASCILPAAKKSAISISTFPVHSFSFLPDPSLLSEECQIWLHAFHQLPKVCLFNFHLPGSFTFISSRPLFKWKVMCHKQLLTLACDLTSLGLPWCDLPGWLRFKY